MPSSYPVYVVDDQELVRILLLGICEEQGWDGHAFESGGAFLDAAPSLVPGCVLLDMRMPGPRGTAVQAELVGQGLAFAVITITGHGDVDMAVESMKLGAVDFIEKPFEAETIVEAVRRAFQRLDRSAAL